MRRHLFRSSEFSSRSFAIFPIFFIVLHRPIILNPTALHVQVYFQYQALLVATKILQIYVFPLSNFHLVISASSYVVLYLRSRQLSFLLYF